MGKQTPRRSARSGARATRADGPHGPRCTCGQPLEWVSNGGHAEALGDELLGAMADKIVDAAPPPDGRTELSPDGEYLRWLDATGREHAIRIADLRAFVARRGPMTPEHRRRLAAQVRAMRRVAVA